MRARGSARYVQATCRDWSKTEKILRKNLRAPALLIAAILGFAGLSVSAGQPAVAATVGGTEYFLTFPTNNQNLSPKLKLFISGASSTTGTVSIAALGVSLPFSVTPGAVTTVEIPKTAQVAGTRSYPDQAVRVSAGAPVTVYGLNQVSLSTDAYLGIPLADLGTEYIAVSYNPVSGRNALATVVATEDATTVRVGQQTVTLDSGDVYSYNSATDITGTLIQADKPVAAFSGVDCAYVPVKATSCDHMVEQLAPVDSWGTQFLSAPLATRSNGDLFRFVAASDNTEISINGTVVKNLFEREYFEQLITGTASITSNKPIQVIQYSNSASFDGVRAADPFMMTLPPFEQYLASYTIATPATGFGVNYVNVVAPATAVGSVKVDGVAIAASSFRAIAGTTFAAAQVPVGVGSHQLQGSAPFGVFSYGFADNESYGYPGGMSLSPIAVVQQLEVIDNQVEQTAGSPACVSVSPKDSSNAVVEGVRVDFAVSGANTAAGFALTDADGVAKYCYTGQNSGTDKVEASLGLVPEVAIEVIWEQEERVAGDDRFETAVEISEEVLPEPAGPVIYVATGADFPDALAGAAAAYNAGGSLLLVNKDSIPSSTVAELQRLKPSKIVVLGGTGSVGQAVFTALGGYAPQVVRHDGADRYETAVLTARDFSASGNAVILASGVAYPDSMSAGSLFSNFAGPVLLVEPGNTLSPAVKAEMHRLAPSRVFVLGGASSVALAAEAESLALGYETVRLGGADRYATSYAVADWVRQHATYGATAVVVNGTAFADGLTAGVLAGEADAPVLLTNGTCWGPAGVAVHLALGEPALTLVGGTASIARPIAGMTLCP